jgi:predicted MPP superfamily phosphohydrolase
MFKKKRFVITILVICLFACILGSVIYTIIDNHRFVVVEETIPIHHLPDSFDGFKILQISDLHGSYFGDEQADLVEAINSLDYDMIAFTGDMSNDRSKDHSGPSTQSVLDLIVGIQPNAPMFWVDGNWGPFTMSTMCDIFSGNLTPVGKTLQEKGVILLTQPVPITRGEDRIWITPVLSKSSFECYQEKLIEQSMGIDSTEQKALLSAIASYEQINDNGEVKLALNHYPFPTNLTESQITAQEHLDYDLILAGHYHGGQIRLPIIGALYIPSYTTENNNGGLFPDQNDVKGITYFGTTPQYISAGLGSSNVIPLLNFRLFNTPEINLITLTEGN